MARTVTHQPQTFAITNTKSGSTVADIKYTPSSLVTSWSNGTAVTYGEGELGGATTSNTYYLPTITDDAVTKYGQ